MLRCEGVDSFHVAGDKGLCEHSNELSGSMKEGEFID
jgi:hypothetical protein